MGQAEASNVIRQLRLAQPWLWTTAVVAFGIGDVLTTTVGLSMAAVHEAGPLTSVLIEQHGLPGMIAVKATVLGLFYLCWTVTPKAYRVGIPLGLTVLGLGVVWWNLTVNLLALQI